MNAHIDSNDPSFSKVPVPVSPATVPAHPGYGAVGFPGGNPDASGDLRANFFKYLGLLLKHKWLAAISVGSALVLGFIATLLMTPLYTGVTTIQIDREAAKVVNVQAQQGVSGNDDPQFYETQYQLLRSRSLAERVAANLALADDADFLRGGSLSPWGRFMGMISARPSLPSSVMDRQKIAVARVMGGLMIRPVPMSRLVEISYVSPNPDWAAKIANAVADNFVGATLDRRYSATSYARQFLEDRLQQLKTKLEESEKAEVAYAQKEGIVSVDESKTEAGSNYDALSKALAAAEADRIRTEQLWVQAQTTDSMGLPQILNDAAIQAARGRQAQLEADYQDKLNVMKPAFPEMVQLRAQITTIERQIKHQVDLIKQSIRSQYEASKEQQAAILAQIDKLKDTVLDQRGRSIQYKLLQREVDTNRALYDGLLQQYKEVGISGAVGTNNVSVVDRAERPGGPTSPRLGVNLLIALVLGLGAAAASILVVELLDDTFKSPEEVEETLGLTVLGVTPVTDLSSEEALKDPSSALSEAYRSLRTALQFSTSDGTPKNLLVTSSRPSEGKSTTSLSLARQFAQLGQRVLLVDADLRNPSLHHVLSLDNSVGLSNYLAGAIEPEEGVQTLKDPDIDLIASGPLPPNPAELLAGPRLSALLAAAEEIYDIVIIDGPPVMGLADAPLLSSLVSGTLVVIEAGETRKGIVRAAMKRLHFARARVLGVLLNKFDSRKAGYTYGYGYGYGGADYYGYGARVAPEALPAAEAPKVDAS